MPRPKPTDEDKKMRVVRAKEWVDFRFDNLITQKTLADTIGVSRRTIQMIEAGSITPYPKTLRKFEAFVARTNGNKGE